MNLVINEPNGWDPEKALGARSAIALVGCTQWSTCGRGSTGVLQLMLKRNHLRETVLSRLEWQQWVCGLSFSENRGFCLLENLWFIKDLVVSIAFSSTVIVEKFLRHCWKQKKFSICMNKRISSIPLPYGQMKSAACISYLLQLTGSVRLRPRYWSENVGVPQLSTAVISPLSCGIQEESQEWPFMGKRKEKCNTIWKKTLCNTLTFLFLSKSNVAPLEWSKPRFSGVLISLMLQH